jgi:collagenase-like PrtC family protease
MFSKKFEVGLSNTNVQDFENHKQYINSYFVGLSPLEECRLNYIYLYTLKEMMSKVNSQDCKLWVAYNTLIVPNKLIKRKIDLLMDLWTEYKFTGYIMADVLLASKVLNFGVPVTISTVNDVRDINDVSRLYQMGFKSIVLSYKTNRNFDFISECCTRYPDVTFTVVVNELCESNCPYRTSHFLRVNTGEASKFSCLVTDKLTNSIQWKLKVLQNTFIPPENLAILDQFPNLIFKLATRTLNMSNQVIIDYIDKYIGQKQYDSILEFFTHHMDITNCDAMKPRQETIKSWLNCKNQCYKCDICKQELRRG